ncbi:hypothetical protein BpHYR1_037991 [Brachionus plicatilis]|uniref:Uncharacterized protein n=1 Tax=Brachionus plicatilis TaxID=10195 RepID=A0A3M7PZG9_BRAPC|nr:hypothetical protein BpHYR1_037991 [Brachionus plicatilis]
MSSSEGEKSSTAIDMKSQYDNYAKQAAESNKRKKKKQAGYSIKIFGKTTKRINKKRKLIKKNNESSTFELDMDNKENI